MLLFLKAGLIYQGVYIFIHNWSVNIFSNAMFINLIDSVKDEFVFQLTQILSI